MIPLNIHLNTGEALLLSYLGTPVAPGRRLADRRKVALKSAVTLELLSLRAASYAIRLPPASMTTILDLRSTEDVQDCVQRAVQTLAEGKVVCLPTETVYGLAASALNAAAVERLADAKGRDSKSPLVIAVKSADEALDYFCEGSKLARRLSRRCWPGPITLVVPCTHPDSAIYQLPHEVQRWVVSKTGSVGIRVVAHPVFEMLLRYCVGPLVLTSANASGQPAPTSGEQAAASLPPDIALMLDDGPTRYGGASTVVSVGDAGYKILRAGVVEEAAVEQFSKGLVLIVCTGNTCRSPMAEALLRRRLGQCAGAATPHVVSAGLAAAAGYPASPQAVEVLNKIGLDLTSHRSRALDENLVKSADLILTMTSAHRHGIVSRWPEASERTYCLCNDGGDVLDPVGGPVELYQQCAELIDRQLEHWCKHLTSDETSDGKSSADQTDRS